MAKNVQLAQASIDEKGGARGGMSGNQKGQPGGETNIRSWHKGSGSGWEELIKCKNPSLGRQAASIMVRLINSNLVGYDQGERNTLWKALKKNGWSVERYIASGEKTETDCSAFTYTAYCVVLPSLREWMEKKGNSAYCGNLWDVFKNYGNDLFDRYTDPAYTRTMDYLEVGDMLNVPSKHTVMVCSIDGSVKQITSPPDNDSIIQSKSSSSSSSGSSYASNNGDLVNILGLSNNVGKLASVSRRNENILKQDEQRKEQFNSLVTAMTNNAPMMGRDILITSELYDSNILKGDQESKKERV